MRARIAADVSTVQAISHIPIHGNPQQLASFSSPVKGGNVSKKHAQTEMKPKKVKPTAHIQPSDMTDDIDIGLLREALAAKSAQAASLKAKLASATEKLQQQHGEKEMLRLAKQELESQVTELQTQLETAEKAILETALPNSDYRIKYGAVFFHQKLSVFTNLPRTVGIHSRSH